MSEFYSLDKLPKGNYKFILSDRRMKQMIYSPESKIEVLFSGVYREHKFCILNLGWHPTAYVECKLHITDYDDDLLDGVSVHGGFTYFDTPHWLNEACVYLGWDYGHCFDYCGLALKYPTSHYKEGKKWTTPEIFKEVKSVIEQLITIEESEDKQ